MAPGSPLVGPSPSRSMKAMISTVPASVGAFTDHSHVLLSSTVCTKAGGVEPSGTERKSMRYLPAFSPA